MGRLRKLHNRSNGSREQHLKLAFDEIDRMGSALGIPGDVRDTAIDIYKLAQKSGIVTGRSIESVAGGSIHISASNVGLPRSLDEIESVSRIERTAIARAKRAISVGLGLAVEPGVPDEFIDRFSSQLEVSQQTVQIAKELIHETPNEYLGSGASPVGIAAAAVYAAGKLTPGQWRTQREVSDTTGVCILTIRKHKNTLLNYYDST